MGMNQEDLQGMQQMPAEGMDEFGGGFSVSRPEQDPSTLVPNADMQDPSIGMEQQDPNAAPDPMEALSHVVLSYMDYTIGVKNNKQLDEPTRSSIMLQMAQAINYFVPLLRDDNQGDLMMKQAELELKREEHQMNMEMKQAEMEFKKQESEMKLQHSQQENQMKLQHTEQQNQMQLQQGKENHEHNIVQSQESHESKMEQQKQAAQLKQSSNPSNKEGKK